MSEPDAAIDQAKDSETPPVADRLNRLIIWAGGIVLLLTGLLLGLVINQAGFIIDNAHTVIVLLSGVVVTLLALVPIVLAAKSWATRRLEYAASQIEWKRVLPDLVKAVVDRDFNQTMQHATSLWRSIPALARAYFTSRSYVIVLGAIAGVLANAVLVAQFVVMQVQTKRLEEQNTLITDQNTYAAINNRIAAIQRISEIQQEEAGRRYDEITRILDESKSEGAQVYALEQLPEAMVMRVELVDPDWKPDHTNPNHEPDRIYEYPNLRPLAERLVAFMKERRLDSAGEDDDVIKSVISTSILRALHRLGYGEFNDNPSFGDCIWDWVFDADLQMKFHDPWESSQLRSVRRHDWLVLQRLLQPDPYPQDRYLDEWRTISLLHMRIGQLNQVDLSGAYLPNAVLTGVHFRGANLRGAHLVGAQLACAALSNAHLQGADLANARLDNADLLESELQGADLSEASLDSAQLFSAELEGVNLHFAKMRGAWLSFAELQGADLGGAELSGADLTHVNLGGANVNGSDWSAREVLLRVGEGLTLRRFPGATAHDLQLFSESICRLDDELTNPLQPLRRKWHLGDEQIARLRWSTREKAIEQLSSVLGDCASQLLVCERPTPVWFGELTNLSGVFMDQATYDQLCSDPTLSVPPFAEVLPFPITDKNNPEEFEKRKKWKIPGEPIEARQNPPASVSGKVD